MYIGQTNNPKLRWSQHKSNAKYNRGQQVITRALSKYGVDVFSFEIIATCITQEDANISEEIIISQYDSRNNGYNVDVGGNTTPKTTETLKKISNSLREYYKTHDGWLKGGSLTDEWKENISKASIGKPGTNKGKEFSDDWKNNISQSQAGKNRISRRRFSPETEQEICRLYIDERKSMYSLAKQFECYQSVIRDVLRRYNTKMRQSNYTGHSNGKNIFTLEKELEICSIYQEGKTSRAALARKYNCGKTTIRDILVRHNIKLKRG